MNCLFRRGDSSCEPSIRRPGSLYSLLKAAGCCLLLFFPPGYTSAGGHPQKQASGPERDSPSERVILPSASETKHQTENRAAENRLSRDRGETVFRSFAEAYPDRTGKIEYRDGDWTIEVYGERFYYAEGRLLPASLRDKMNEYNPHPFYNYVKELPPWKPYTKEESERMKEQEALRSRQPPKRSPHFYDALWRTRNREESWEHVKQIRFLGHPVIVHYSILTKLSLVEELILREAKTNAAVKEWLNNLKSLDAWNWRNIASSQSRSFHAYGAAIDLMPKSFGGKETYWLWTASKVSEWWSVPYTSRFHPPGEVVKAFESMGFIWGGKWRYYDTMHFEYRPEILVLSGIAMMDPRDLR